MAKKPLASIWVICITAFITMFVTGGGIGGYLYWQGNFSKPKSDNSQEESNKASKVEEKVTGKNLVTITSDEEKLILNFINLETSKKIKKEVALGTTIRGGKWAETNSNALIQFNKEGNAFILAEKKESNLSDKKAYFKLLRINTEGKIEETVIDSGDYDRYGNFLYTSEGLFYLKARSSDKKSKNTDEILYEWDLVKFDQQSKEETILSQDIGSFFQKELVFRDGKIVNMYKQSSRFYEISVDTATKKIEKKALFSYRKTYDHDLNVEDISVSPSGNLYIYKDFTTKDGYSLKVYDKTTKKTSTAIKDKNYSFSNISWLNEDELTFTKTPALTNTSDSTNNEIVKMSLSFPDAVESLCSSSKVITLLFVDGESTFYLEDQKVIYLKGKDKKELAPDGLLQPTDILYVGIFDY